VTIIPYDIDRNPTGIGSGFFINRKGHLITNHHVLKGAYGADVKTSDGNIFPVELVIAENEHSDLVKVQVAIPETSVHWVSVTDSEPSIAERVLVVGSLLGLEQTVILRSGNYPQWVRFFSFPRLFLRDPAEVLWST